MLVTTKTIDWDAIETALSQGATTKDRLLNALHELKEAYKKTNPDTGETMPDCECMTKVVAVIELIDKPE